MRRLGVVIANLGTPLAPSRQAVSRYLGEFLVDKRVVSLPAWWWKPFLHGFVLTFRSHKLATLYRSIWLESGSPLRVIGFRVQNALEEALKKKWDRDIPVALGMTYGFPSLGEALLSMRNRAVERVIVLPMFPQFSSAATGAVFDRVAKHYQNERYVPEICFVQQYYDEPYYIRALAQAVLQHRSCHGFSQKLLFSFHGIPEKHYASGDPYPDQCWQTARMVAEVLQLSDGDWDVAFQSRFGRTSWTKPYTDILLRKWSGDGINSVDIIAPGFSADCLETLDELAVRNRDLFLKCGGVKYHYIPALNDSVSHIDLLVELVGRYCGR